MKRNYMLSSLCVCLLGFFSSCVTVGRFNEVTNHLASRVTPPGTISSFAGDVSQVPYGWLLCDGKSFNTKTLPDLFAAIKNNWGGDGISEFKVPDLRGVFLRGSGNGTDKDPDAVKRVNAAGIVGGVGSYQDDAFQGHRHDVKWTPDHNPAFGGGNNTDGGNERNGFVEVKLTVTDPITDGKNGDPRISRETRPKNVYVNYIIKI